MESALLYLPTPVFLLYPHCWCWNSDYPISSKPSKPSPPPLPRLVFLDLEFDQVIKKNSMGNFHCPAHWPEIPICSQLTSPPLWFQLHRTAQHSTKPTLCFPASMCTLPSLPPPPGELQVSCQISQSPSSCVEWLVLCINLVSLRYQLGQSYILAW